MKRVAVALSLIAALGLTLAATGVAGQGKSSTSAEPVKMTIWAYWNPGTHELRSFNKLVAEYDKKHPDLRLRAAEAHLFDPATGERIEVGAESSSNAAINRTA